MTDNPYQAPSAEILNTRDHFDGYDETQFFSPKGRFNRSRFVAYYFGFYIGAIFVMALLGSLIGSLGSTASLILMAIVYIPVLILMVIFGVRRLHDLDQSGWFLVLMIIPILNLFFMLYLFFKRGTDGINKFGPPQKPSSKLTIAFAWIMGLLLPLGIIAAIAIPQYQQYVQNAAGG